MSSPIAMLDPPQRRVSFSTKTPRQTRTRLHRSPYVFSSPIDSEKEETENSQFSDSDEPLSPLKRSFIVNKEDKPSSESAEDGGVDRTRIAIPRLDFSAKKPVDKALLPKKLFNPTPIRLVHAKMELPDSPTRSKESTKSDMINTASERFSGKAHAVEHESWAEEEPLALDFGNLCVRDQSRRTPSRTTSIQSLRNDVVSISESEEEVYIVPVRRINRIISSDDDQPVLTKSYRTPRKIYAASPSTSVEDVHHIQEVSSGSSSPCKTQARKPGKVYRVLEFPDSEAEGDSQHEDEDEDLDLDDSLNDFIVDDSDASDCGESSDKSTHSDILSYSPPPRKVYTLPNLDTLTLSDDSPPPTSVKNGKKTNKKWAMERVAIAERLFQELDVKVFEGKLGVDGAGTSIEWSKRLLTTAGTASLNKVRKGDGLTISKQTAKITLSIKVLSEEDQIVNTVAHEMCHLATWLISNEHRNPHGKVFKSWGRKIMRKRPDITVTTKHDYEIAYKYEWMCSNGACGKIYRRHSKSIDLKKHACGSCRSKLEPLFTTKANNPFQVYLKQNMANAKAACPGQSHGEVMRGLSKRWAEGLGDHEEYWKVQAGLVKV